MSTLIIPSDEEIAGVLPNMRGGYEVVGEESEFPYWISYQDIDKKNPGGYAFVTRGEGFASTIQTLVGTDANGKIINIKTLFHEETPGYGDKIAEIREGEKTPWFIYQFIGKSASDNIELTQEGGDIDAISGATISSTAVTNSIINGLNNLNDALIFPKREIPQEEESNDKDFMEQLMNQNKVEKDTEEENDIMAQLMSQSDKNEEENIMAKLIKQAGEEATEIKTSSSVDEMLKEILPNMPGGYDKKGDGSEFPYWIGYRYSGKSTPGGYIFIVNGKGFASTIETMVSVDVNGKIAGIKIISHEETPGYGDKIEEIREGENEPWFTKQFIGKTISDNIALKKDSGDIDAISGATISSITITESINTGLKKLMEIMKSQSNK